MCTSVDLTQLAISLLNASISQRSQSKELAEFMIDAKVPRAWRNRVPIVCSPRQIVWVVGWRPDDRAKVTGDTKLVLRLEFRQGLKDSILP